MLLRRLARPLLATSFVYDGVQAVKHPAEHATAAREGAALVTERLGRSPLTEAQVTNLVRLHGILTTVCGLALAVGKAPRTAALALAALTVPLAVVNQPFTSEGDDRDTRTGKFLRNLGSLGAALIAGVDLEGRPGLTYRVSHAGTAAARSARRSARDARRSASQASHLASHSVSAAARRAEKAADRAAKQGRRVAQQSQKALAGHRH